jgi:hypothetical protein
MKTIKVPAGSSHLLHRNGDEGEAGGGAGDPDFLGGPDPVVIGEAAPIPGRTCSLGPKHPR